MKDIDMPLSDRVDAAIKRVTAGRAPMRVPVEATDVDIVLADCKTALKATTDRSKKEMQPTSIRQDAGSSPAGRAIDQGWISVHEVAAELEVRNACAWFSGPYGPAPEGYKQSVAPNIVADALRFERGE